MTLSIPLKYQHTRPFVMGWVIFYNLRSGESRQNVFNEKAFFRQLVVSMI